MIRPCDGLAMDILSTNVFVSDSREAGADLAGEALPPDDGATRCKGLLRNAGLRPTRQRLMLGQLLFLDGHRHVTAEALFEEAMAANMQLSLATVYNTLNQFTEAGLLRRVAADGAKSFFDTDTSLHPHFYLEGEDILLDVAQDLVFEKMPDALPGHDIARLDVIVHIRRRTS
jgi:Fur family iron response transcriptional regulator